MSTGTYILDGHTPVPVPLLEWASWFNVENRRVADDVVGEVRVSTVFLGIDHAFGNGPPLLFETMIFGGEHDEDQRRYSTWGEAAAGHAEMLALATQEEDKP